MKEKLKKLYFRNRRRVLDLSSFIIKWVSIAIIFKGVWIWVPLSL